MRDSIISCKLHEIYISMVSLISNNTLFLKFSLYLLFVFIFYGCSNSENDDISDLLDDAPFTYSISGHTNGTIDAENFDLKAEWTELQSVNLVEVAARLFATRYDTTETGIYFQSYGLSIVHASAWPGTGSIGTASLTDIRDDGQPGFFVRLNSQYSFQPAEGYDASGEILSEGAAYLGSAGTIDVTTSTTEFLRGEFNLVLDLFDYSSWNGDVEVREGPEEEVLTLTGFFDLNLLQTKVDRLSMN